MDRTLLSLAADVLRRPLVVVEAVTHDREALAWALPRLVLLVLLGGAVFGAVAGMHRGGPQILFAAVKLPLLLLIPPLIVMPAARALVVLEGHVLSPERLAAAALVGMARTAVLSTALTPPLWLLYRAGLPHRTALLVLLGALALVGLPGLLTVTRAVFPPWVPRGPRAALILLLGMTFAQTGWLLRPFMSLHGDDYPVVCGVNRDIFQGLAGRLGSSRALDRSWDCPNPLVWGGAE